MMVMLVIITILTVRLNSKYNTCVSPLTACSSAQSSKFKGNSIGHTCRVVSDHVTKSCAYNT